MSDRLKFRAFYQGRFIYKSLTDANYYDKDNKCIGLANTLPNSLKWEQCTGLRDKNGKLIYEGDIVIYEVFVSDWSDEKRKGYGIVYYDDDQHALGLRTIKQTFTSSFGLNKLISEIEVIGNIHENPEFLNADNA